MNNRYEFINNEIKQKENLIKQLEEKLQETKKELKNYKKYTGLDYEKYREYGNEQCPKGLCDESLITALRQLILTIVGVKKLQNYDRHGNEFTSIDFPSKLKKVADLNIQETKLCNDFLDEMYPIIKKYVNIFIKYKAAEVLKNESKIN